MCLESIEQDCCFGDDKIIPDERLIEKITAIAKYILAMHSYDEMCREWITF